MMETIKSASDVQQAKVAGEIEGAVVRKSKEVMKTKGDQILQLIEASTVDPDLGNNVDLVA